MDNKLRRRLIKEICRKEDVNCQLEYLINMYNEKYKDLNISQKDFGMRLAYTPEEACYCKTILTCPIEEQIMSDEEIYKKEKEYNILLKQNIFPIPHEELIKDNYLHNLKWGDLY